MCVVVLCAYISVVSGFAQKMLIYGFLNVLASSTSDYFATQSNAQNVRYPRPFIYHRKGFPEYQTSSGQFLHNKAKNTYFKQERVPSGSPEVPNEVGHEKYCPASYCLRIHIGIF